MPRTPKLIKRPVGSPQKEIDWVRVDKLLISGLTGTKIADAIGVHPDTLYERCEKVNGANFSAYAQQKRTIGDGLLQEAQFDKAIGNTDKGDNTLLIWLGKQRLNQRETQEISVSAETTKSFMNVMAQLGEMQKQRENKEESDNPLLPEIRYDETT